MKSEKDVELFVSNSAPIYELDIYKLILEDPKYDISKVFPEIKTLEQPVPNEIQEKILRLLKTDKYKYRALANHDLFQ